MAFYKWPRQHNGYTFNWDEMIQDSNHDSWPRLFAIIGEEMNVEYYEDSASTSTDDICSGFAAMGYKDMILSYFTKDAVNNDLRRSKPLLVTGHHSKNNQQPFNTGHGWVIDGGYNIINGLAIGIDPVGSDYYRCIWGWGGEANGYYKFTSSSFSTSNGFVFKNLHFVQNLNIKN